MKPQIQSTIYPITYDKNALSNPKRLTKNYNAWIRYIFEEVYIQEHSQAAVREIKELV